MPRRAVLLTSIIVLLLSGMVVAGEFPLTVTDDFDRQISFATRPQRLVSLAPSWTEILFALGLDDQLVGVTTYCDYPPAASAKQKVGGFSAPNLELIVSLKADVVFGTSVHQKIVPELERRGIKFVGQKASSVADVMENIRVAAKIGGVPERARQVNQGIEAAVTRVRQTLKASSLPDAGRRKVLYLVWDEPIMSVGPQTLIHDMLTQAGGVSITSSATTDYPSYSLESVLVANPDVVVAPGVPGGMGLDLQALKTKSGWKTLEAVKNDHVRLVEDNLVSRAGPRVGEGILEFGKALYPELFK